MPSGLFRVVTGIWCISQKTYIRNGRFSPSLSTYMSFKSLVASQTCLFAAGTHPQITLSYISLSLINSSIYPKPDSPCQILNAAFSGGDFYLLIAVFCKFCKNLLKIQKKNETDSPF